MSHEQCEHASPIVWIVKHPSMTVFRRCPGCGGRHRFDCTGKFRVNANRKMLDVWLLYRCAHCQSTMNVEILERVPVSKMDSSLRDAFTANDPELARRYAEDPVFLEQRGFQVELAGEPQVFGDELDLATLTGDSNIEIVYPTKRSVRLDRVLSTKLRLSRSIVRRLLESGAIEPKESLVDRASPPRVRLVLHGQQTRSIAVDSNQDHELGAGDDIDHNSCDS